MDNEPVDDFKGLVCFRYTLEESQMCDTFDRRDTLAAQPSSSDDDGSNDATSDAGALFGSSIKSVGRDTVSSACNLRASAALRTKIRSRSGDEVYEWERWLRRELLWLRNNQQLPQEKKDQPEEAWQGKDFFADEIEPASIALYKFRTGRWDEFACLLKAGKGEMTKKERDTTIAQVNFLRDITAGVASSKAAEIVVLELLLRAEEGIEEGAGSRVVSRYLDEILPLIEKWTLWMALTRPSPMQRHSRVFSPLDAMDDLDSLGLSGLLDEEMAQNFKESLDGMRFGATSGGKRLAAAILRRLSTQQMAEGGRTCQTATMPRQWMPSDRVGRARKDARSGRMESVTLRFCR